MEYQLKLWQTPKLVILARSEPAESLTSYCKAAGAFTGSQATSNIRCQRQILWFTCIQCSTIHTRAS
ncbi:MAG: hypothetical protein AB1664_06565 [Thermodesulfobacteriota bacterium]